MTTKLLTLFTRTPLHVGAGASVGAVDQPIIRERHTRFPVIPGSSLKGVLADLFMKEGTDVTKVDRKDKNENVIGHDYIRINDGNAWRLFGDNSNENGRAASGSLLVGESKILAFPVRSAMGCFAYVTCPLALQRFVRDTGFEISIPPVPDGDSAVVEENSNLVFVGTPRRIILEEYPLDVVTGVSFDSAKLNALCDDTAWHDANAPARRFAVVSNDLFQYFVENGCEIAQHNRIDDEKGVVEGGALFNQENVPSEAIFYCILHAKEKEDFKALEDKLEEDKHLLQIGADITTGLGWCSVKLQDVPVAIR